MRRQRPWHSTSQAHDYARPSLKVVVRSDSAAGETKGADKALDYASGDQHSAGLAESTQYRCPDEEAQTRQSKRRRPTTSASRPPSIRKPPKVSAGRQPPIGCSQPTTPRCAASRATHTLTIAMSRISMNCAAQSSASIQIRAMTCDANPQPFRWPALTRELCRWG